jgi:hypothetical protein
MKVIAAVIGFLFGELMCSAAVAADVDIAKGQLTHDGSYSTQTSGKRWFCSAAEAEAAGCRAPKN